MLDSPGFYELGEPPRPRPIRTAGINWQPMPTGHEITNCRIVDLSWTGIGFLVLDNRKLKIGDFVNLRFRLENNAGSMVKQTCRVKHINGNFVGGMLLQET
jgi:hypothetical protein